MKYDFTQIVERRGGDSLKWNRYSNQNVLPMWVADMDFRIANEIEQALTQRVHHGVLGYAPVDASLVLAAQSWFARRWQWDIPAEWFVAIPAVVPGLNYAVQSLAQDGPLAHPTPIYGPIAQVAKHLGMQALTFEISDSGWDLKQLEQALQQGAKTVMLCCPQNPLGRTFTQTEYRQLADLIMAYDAYVVSDDIHGDLMLNGEPHLPLVKACPELQERVLTLVAAGKTFNIAGLPFAFAITANVQWRQRLQRVLSGFAPSPCVASMTAVKAAWQHGDEWLDQLLPVLIKNRDRLLDVLQALPQLKVYRPEATYLLWIDCSALGWQNPAAHLEQWGLGVSDGRDFGQPQCIRLNFGCPTATLEQGIERLRNAVLDTVNRAETPISLTN